MISETKSPIEQQIMARFFPALCLILLIFTASCKKTTDRFESDSPAEYMNLQTGKYIIYALDSTRFVNFGQKDTVIHYLAKDLVSDEITDNLGRRAWKIIRYLRPLSSTESDWKVNMVYTVVPTEKSVELIEHNLRFIKLELPIKENFTWFGNAYLPNSPYSELYDFNAADVGTGTWEYHYQNPGQELTINGLRFPETVTVHQVDESKNLPLNLMDQNLAYQKYSVEQYAKGVGLIFKEVLLWEFQPGSTGSAGNRTGFGIRMSIVDHN